MDKIKNVDKIEITTPSMDDLEKVVQVEKDAWPDIGDSMVADYQKFQTRIELGTIKLLYFYGQPAGVISYQYPGFTDSTILATIHDDFHKSKQLLSWDNLVQKYQLPPDWYQATNDGFIIDGNQTTHDEKSDCVFLIGVGVDSALKGNGLVNRLISTVVQEEKKKGKKYIMGYGRLPQLSESYEKATLIQAESHLLKKKNGCSLPFDYGARFHVFNGADSVSVIPNAMDDPESLNYGFLALYQL